MRKKILVKRDIPIILLALVLVICVSEVSAGVTGKITGKATDAQTGEPLPGVNVTIQGTAMGAATDMEGDYFIINVQPGTYTLVASMMGYTTINKTGVMVYVDHTITTDFNLNPTVISGEEVTVVATRDVVAMDMSASQIVADIEKIAEVPMVKDLAEFINLQAGIEDDLIRGGGLDQTQFMMDGLMVVDNRGNHPMMMVNLSSIKEVSIIKGGFNAEYGNVRSGLINVITKEGSPDRYSGSVDFRYSPAHLKHGGVSLFDPDNYFLRSYLDTAVCYDGTTKGSWDAATQEQYPKFSGWDFYSRRVLKDKDPNNDVTPQEARDLFIWQHTVEGCDSLGQKEGKYGHKPDWNGDVSFSGLVPFIGKYLGNLTFFASYYNNWEMFALPTNREYFKEENMHLKFISHLSPSMKLIVEGLYGEMNTLAASPFSGRDHYFTNGSAILFSNLTGDGEDNIKGSHLYYPSALSPFDVYRSMQGLSFDHVLSPNTFYNFRISHTMVKNVCSGWDRMRDTTTVRYFGTVPVDEQPYGYWDGGGYPSESTIDNMLYNGKAARTRDWSEVNTVNAKFDITSQVDKYNQVKAGIIINYDDIDTYYGYKEPAQEVRTWWRKSRNFPIRGGAYVQDKLEFEGMIANVGLRLDYNDPNTDWYTVDRYSKYFNSTYRNNFTEVAPKEETKGHLKLSPRLGISHPISENSKLYFNYGHFYSMPTTESMYDIDYGTSGSGSGIAYIGNPSAELPKTVAYELGWEYDLADMILLHASGYYKDITDQTGSVYYHNYDGSVNYRTIENRHYADIRGFELRIDKRFGRWITGWVNYNYMVTTSGYVGKLHYYQDPREQDFYDRDEEIEQERPIARPILRSNLMFSTPKDWGPEFYGIRPLGEFNVSTIFHWKAGDWITNDPLKTGDLYQNVQWRDRYSFDLRISKRAPVFGFKITLFADIQNVFNNKLFDTRSFADDKDKDAYYESLHLEMYGDQIYQEAGLIAGNDRPGDLRVSGATYQPMQFVYSVADVSKEKEGVIYFEGNTGQYKEFIEGDWSTVSDERIDKIIEDKAYINDPNIDFLKFLSVRSVYLGIKIDF